MLIVTREGNKKRRTVIVPIPDIPIAPNVIARAHWGKRKAEVDRWTTTISALLDIGERSALRNNAQKKKPSVVTLFAVFIHRRKIFDPDNAVGALKYVIDGMVRAGLLRNDTEEFVKVGRPCQGGNICPAMVLIMTWTE